MKLHDVLHFRRLAARAAYESQLDIHGVTLKRQAGFPAGILFGDSFEPEELSRHIGILADEFPTGQLQGADALSGYSRQRWRDLFIRKRLSGHKGGDYINGTASGVWKFRGNVPLAYIAGPPEKRFCCFFSAHP